MSTYHFAENLAYFVLRIELLLTVLSNIEREAALKDSVFWWVACLTDKVLWSLNSLILNSVRLDGLVYPIPVVIGGQMA